MHVRSFFTFLLVAILLACPAMCRATEVACCPGHEVEECSDEPGQQAPTAPTDADSCICSGTAPKAEDGQAGKLLTGFAALLPESFETSVRPLFAALSRRSLPTGPDDWLKPVRLHVLFEVFRC